MSSVGLFNGYTELLLRALMVLSRYSNLSVDQIAEIDFKVTYGSYLGISDKNLHGDNEFGLQEYALRRKRLNDVIIKGVLKGIIVYSEQYDQGFVYSISSKGEKVIEELNKSDSYFIEYLNNLKKVPVPSVKDAENFGESLDSKLWVNEFEG